MELDDEVLGLLVLLAEGRALVLGGLELGAEGRNLPFEMRRVREERLDDTVRVLAKADESARGLAAVEEPLAAASVALAARSIVRRTRWPLCARRCWRSSTGSHGTRSDAAHTHSHGGKTMDVLSISVLNATSRRSSAGMVTPGSATRSGPRRRSARCARVTPAPAIATGSSRSATTLASNVHHSRNWSAHAPRTHAAKRRPSESPGK